MHDVYGCADRRDRLLEMVRMTPFRERLAARLSGGMKQKLALVSTLVHTPELLVLDEPTTGVDPVSRRDFWRLLARLQRDGLTILLTTPYLDEAERCTRVAFVDHGRVLTLDTPDALRAAEPGVMVELVARAAPAAVAALRRAPGVAEVEVFGRAAARGAAEGRREGRRGRDRGPRRGAAASQASSSLRAARDAVARGRLHQPDPGARCGWRRRGETMRRALLLPLLLSVSAAPRRTRP